MLDATEQALAAAIGVPHSWQSDFVFLSGWAAIIWGCVFVLGFGHRVIAWLNTLALIVLIALVAIAAPV